MISDFIEKVIGVSPITYFSKSYVFNYPVKGLVVFFNEIFIMIVSLSWLLLFIYALYKSINSYFYDNKEVCIKEPVVDSDQAKEVIEALKTFRGQKGIMIVGKWGVGKTEFYKNSVRNEIKSSLPNNEIIEISCFGTNNVDCLILDILNKTMFLESVGIFFNQITKIISSSYSFKKTLLPKEKIIVFDDFERYNGSFLDILGFIDYLIQEKKCGVIILCNEEKLKNKKKYDDFIEFSEKVIVKHDFTITKESIRKILSGEFIYKDKIYKFNDVIIDKVMKLVCEIENLRTSKDAIFDIRNIIEKFLKIIDTFDASEILKDEYRKLYFDSCSSEVVKCCFIRRFGREDMYEAYLNEKDKNKACSSLDDLLKIILSIKLDNDFIIKGEFNPYTSNASMQYLKKGVKAFDDDDFYLLIEEDILWIAILNVINKDYSNDNTGKYLDPFIIFFQFIQDNKLNNRPCGFDFYSELRCKVWVLFKSILIERNFKLPDNLIKIVSTFQYKLDQWCSCIFMLDESDAIPKIIDRGVIYIKKIPDDIDMVSVYWFDEIKRIEQKTLKITDFSASFFKEVSASNGNSTNHVLCREVTSICGGNSIINYVDMLLNDSCFSKMGTRVFKDAGRSALELLKEQLLC